MFWADYLNDPYTPGAYLVLPGDPVTGFLWDVCMDVDEDGDIDEDDYYIVQGNLFNACYFWGDCFWYACGDPRFP